jgi:hypothetical protein
MLVIKAINKDKRNKDRVTLVLIVNAISTNK